MGIVEAGQHRSCPGPGPFVPGMGAERPWQGAPLSRQPRPPPPGSPPGPDRVNIRSISARTCVEEFEMSQVRVLVGTRKGAFILTADGRRESWNVEGPLFAGWEIYHLKGSPVDPDRL